LEIDMNKSVQSFLLIICVIFLTACTRQTSTSNASQTCKLNLKIFIRQGTNVNLTLFGQVEFGSNTWSRFKGDFIEEDRTAHPISLSFDGSAIHFTLEHAQGRIYGTGMLENDLATCTGTGGGTLSGPALGDLGDWRGEWIRQQIKTTPQPPQKETFAWELSSFLCNNLLFISFGLFAAFILFKLFAPYKLRALFKKTPTPPSKPVAQSSLRKVNLSTRPETGKGGRSLVEYLATYTADDKLFDLSFEIEKSSQYLGECGLTATKALEPSGQVTALEFWLFDARSAQTVSQVLMSTFCFNQETLRHELESKGQAQLLQPGEILTIETKTLIAKAKVLQVEYEANHPNPQSIFKQVALRIGVWIKID
jgi:hypothetical protein